ncbi:MAG TPA: zf-HC2 domain-containing protein [Planctomycetota bacterium]|nr:zf-HC2 domain-containing protein [Planctomycetota bacterium]
MKCHEAKRHLDLFMDGELSVPENLKVLEHLNLCRSCAEVYEGEKALRALLRTRVGSLTAPPGLAERLLSEEVPVASPVETFARRGPWFPVAAAAGFFLVILALVFTTPAEMPRTFANEMSSKHKETHEGFCGVHRDNCLCLCSRCDSGKDNSVGRLFHRSVAYEVCSHDLKDLGYQMIGAEVFERKGGPVCWTVYHDAAGNSISHGLVPTKIAKEPGPLYVCDGVERPVVMMPATAGMTCVFVFDNETEAQRFREARTLK